MDGSSLCARQGKKAKKVKSGCRTCKIRKVKCDEGRPICSKCSSTGRICGGYGIWGGGETIFSQQQRLASEREVRMASRPPVVVFLPRSSLEERNGFEWFKCKTAPKLPGSFQSKFWSTLLHQASLAKPPVLQAVLALSAIHRGGHIGNQFCTVDYEEAALRHYGRAIKGLQPHFTDKSKSSCRIALIACAVFINLELLRGHFQTANTHLENGIRILQDMQLISEQADGVFRDTPGLGSTDTWIVEIFARFQLQSEIFRCGYEHELLLLELTEWSVSDAAPTAFTSLKQAWEALTPLLNQILRLVSLARQQAHRQPDFQISEQMLQTQYRIQKGLASWRRTSEFLKREMFGDEKRAFHLLIAYHTLANIMLDTALDPNTELIYDTQTTKFQELMRQLTELHDESLEHAGPKTVPNYQMDMERSVTDIGWVAMLYYTVTKCRVPAVRAEAIKLLESRFHREGMWDSKVMACVARKVVDLEEADFYKDTGKLRRPTQDGLEHTLEENLPPLPNSHRLREVEVILSGAPMDTIMLFGKSQHDEFENRVLFSEYHMQSGCWIDSSIDSRVSGGYVEMV
ncbi:hypothetical protein BKA64DRAFT_573978 [Cadophora sp. MPI-SDFR-AT-0126]|nr:hypothetical protein BKA64DRAFT_573978 [Leotiomycetes sp. MPI-SDFR-AT-0126]